MTQMTPQDVARQGEDSGEEEDTGELEDQRSEVVVMAPPTSGEVKAEDGGVQETKMSRSVSDTTLRRHALHLNLSPASSVLPSFTPLHQFKVRYSNNKGREESLL